MRNISLAIFATLALALPAFSQLTPSGGGSGISPGTRSAEIRTTTQDFYSVWTDDTCTTRIVVSKLPTDAQSSPLDNAEQHAADTLVASAVFPPDGGVCGDNDDDVGLPVANVTWTDSQGVDHGANSIAAANVFLAANPQFAPPPSPDPQFLVGTVGPSNDPKGSYTSDWTDTNGLHHTVLTRQKWNNETSEQLALRHSAAVVALLAHFPVAHGT